MTRLLLFQKPKKTISLLILIAHCINAHAMQEPAEKIKNTERPIKELQIKRLMIACQHHDYTTVDEILGNQGIKPDAVYTEFDDSGAKQTTALCQAAYKNDASLINTLVWRYKATVDFAKPISGITALFVAAAFGRKKAIQALLAAGAKPNQCNVDGVSPLLAAAQHGHTKAVQLLLKAEARLDICAGDNSCKINVLTQTAQNGHLKALEVILDNKNQFPNNTIDINQARLDGSTALHRAVINDHKKVAECLLAAGADKGLKDKAGKTPGYYAVSDPMKELLGTQKRQTHGRADQNASWPRKTAMRHYSLPRSKKRQATQSRLQ